ncbi:MAG: hypothetical protein M1837_000450 [Sclerophora amabilis]|nr:MAG: hypothetical protein M1837_000450 [Sclerophora amabilis]
MQLLAILALATGALATYHNEGGSDSQDSGSKAPSEKNTAEPDLQGAGGGSSEVKGVSVILVEQNFGAENGVRMFSQPANVGKKHKVKVGGADLTYQPDSIKAEVGDVVEFEFGMKNHTVTQSGFDKPCVKLEGGVDSGFMPNPDGDMGPPPSYSFQVTDTKPIWFYCRQKKGTHCGKGMVFSINPTEEKSHEKFKQLAIQQNGTEAAPPGETTAPPPPETTAPPPPENTVAPPPENTAAPPPNGTAPAAAPTDAPVSTTILYSSGAPAAPTDAPADAPPAAPAPETPAESPAEVPAGAPPAAPPGSSAGAPAAPPAATGPAKVQPGTEGADACSCKCLCGVGSFGPGQGIGNYGGQGGTIPAHFGSM